MRLSYVYYLAGMLFSGILGTEIANGDGLQKTIGSGLCIAGSTLAFFAWNKSEENDAFKRGQLQTYGRRYHSTHDIKNLNN